MQIDTKRYKVYTWKNWMMIHWILNPGLAVNELLLGQRIPKISLEDKSIDKPREERTFVPCPHCETLHDGRMWSTTNGTGFKNWFGLYCTNCGNIIPCILNVTSFILLAASFPIWGVFRSSLKKKWLRMQPERYTSVHLERKDNAFTGKRWITTGLSWGFIMFLFMAVALPLYDKEAITLTTLGINGIIWALGGLLFGYTMKLFNAPKKLRS